MTTSSTQQQPTPEDFLRQYQLAGKLLGNVGATTPNGFYYAEDVDYDAELQLIRVSGGLCVIIDITPRKAAKGA